MNTHARTEKLEANVEVNGITDTVNVSDKQSSENQRAS